MEAYGYCALRVHTASDEEFLDLESTAGTAEGVRDRLHEESARLPGWDRAHPVRAIVAVRVERIAEGQAVARPDSRRGRRRRGSEYLEPPEGP